MDYKDTIRIPKTKFSIYGNLNIKEPEILKRWESVNIYKKLREKALGKAKYILHDGPPYANGHIHTGHAMNKILKDIIIRAKSILGYDAPFVVGWDCHGLPIEWKIEEEYKKQKINKKDIDINEFRQKCRDFALNWLNIQREEFKRLGLLADLDNPYNTMDFSSESAILKEIKTFLMNDYLYFGFKPVLWSVVEETSLAEAEVEYQEHESDTAFVAFEIVKSSNDKLVGTKAVIWTTTPWTLPANRAIAYGENIEYCLILVKETENELIAKGSKFVVAESRLADFVKEVGVQEFDILEKFVGLPNLELKHPLHGKGYDFVVKAFSGDFVTTDTGTGIVHIAPSHGEDDWRLGKTHNLEMPMLLHSNGVFKESVPLFAGEHIFKVNQHVLEELKINGSLLNYSKMKHSYPYSWRSKKPLIYNLTRQIFVSLEKHDLREKALKELETVSFFPKSGLTRIKSMVGNRPDWCISRQRAWGVPIAIFFNKETFEPLKDEETMDNIIRAFEKKGASAWFEGDPYEFLSSKYKKEDYQPVFDVVDVWFDSGCTQSFVLEERKELQAPADMYLEGSDQHRGWFQSSLLNSVVKRGITPFRALFTHGFVLDGKGQKMSKSLGNTIVPEDIIRETGADILRIWVASSDFHEDVKISKEIINQQKDIYKKIRNTMRYLIANTINNDAVVDVDCDKLPALEKYLLFRLQQMEEKFICTFEHDFDFHNLFITLHSFCSNDLSAFYFDIRKDVLYCDGDNSHTFKSSITVLRILLDRLLLLFAPFIPFTVDEVAEEIGRKESVHLQTLKKGLAIKFENNFQQKWQKFLEIKKVVDSALEIQRKNSSIGSNLDASVSLYLSDEYKTLINEFGLNLEEILLVSEVLLFSIQDATKESIFTLPDVSGVAVVSNIHNGIKCPRCWKKHRGKEELCQRCSLVVGEKS